MCKNIRSISDDFGAKLKTQRGKSGLTIREAAEKCGVAYSYYFYLENGKCSGVSLRIAEQVANAMGLQIIIQTIQ